LKTRIITAAVLLPVFFAILYIFPPFVLTIVVSIICGIAVFELLNVTGIGKNKKVLVYAIISAVLVPQAIYISALYDAFRADTILVQTESGGYIIPEPVFFSLTLITLIFSLFFILVCLLFIEAVLAFKNEKVEEKGKHLKFRQIPIVICAGIVIPCMLSSVVSLKAMPYGHFFVLLPVISTILTDSGAYFTGIFFGKRKAFPKISPHKTVEGCIGGVITGTIGMMIYGMILTSVTYTTSMIIVFPALMIYGIIGAVVTEFGDLVFSFIKRKYDVKDYGKLIPGHGGVLDRFDSIIFTAPVMYLLIWIFPAIVY